SRAEIRSSSRRRISGWAKSSNTTSANGGPRHKDSALPRHSPPRPHSAAPAPHPAARGPTPRSDRVCEQWSLPPHASSPLNATATTNTQRCAPSEHTLPPVTAAARPVRDRPNRSPHTEFCTPPQDANLQPRRHRELIATPIAPGRTPGTTVSITPQPPAGGRGQLAETSTPGFESPPNGTIASEGISVMRFTPGSSEP